MGGVLRSFSKDGLYLQFISALFGFFIVKHSYFYKSFQNFKNTYRVSGSCNCSYRFL